MKLEQEHFVLILSDFLYGRATLPPAGLDWEQLAAYAKSHALEGVVWQQCGAWLKEQTELKEISELLSARAAACAYYAVNRERALAELDAAFAREGLRFFTVKGTEVAALYPVPALRTMGDLDIVLSTEDRQRARPVLEGLGYTAVKESYEHEYRRRIVTLELHDRLLYNENLEPLVQTAFFNGCWDYVSDGRAGRCHLNWSFHFLFLLEHLKHHFSQCGVGFRQFLDLAVVVKSSPDLDWPWIEEQLRAIGLLDFARNTLTLCSRWWGVASPLGTAELAEDFYEESTCFVFANGVFGFDNEDFAVNAKEKLMRSTGVPIFLQPVMAASRRIFISYEEAARQPGCAFVKGRKYLLPIAWGYRLCYIARNKKGYLGQKKREIFGSARTVDSHRKLMDRWGI